MRKCLEAQGYELIWHKTLNTNIQDAVLFFSRKAIAFNNKMHTLLASKEQQASDQPIKNGLVSLFDFYNCPTPQKYHDIDFNQIMLKRKLTDPTKKNKDAVKRTDNELKVLRKLPSGVNRSVQIKAQEQFGLTYRQCQSDVEQEQEENDESPISFQNVLE